MSNRLDVGPAGNTHQKRKILLYLKECVERIALQKSASAQLLLTTYTIFNHDISSQLFEENAEWEFVVSPYQSGEVTLTWERTFETTPSGYEFELVDGES